VAAHNSIPERDLSAQDEHGGVLDAQQLARIQAVHRGFLYQHLYAVACLFQLSPSGPTSVTVERDEDVEQECAKGRRYIQVKTRSDPLVYSDISSALERFETIRAEHVAGRRRGGAELVVVSNAELSPSLRDRIASPEWPKDVLLLTPEAADLPSGVPRPWRDLESAVDACVALAATVPHRVVAEETLTWKLAALVQVAAAGGVPGAVVVFKHADLPTLLEQLQIPLQQLPSPPSDYRPQDREPAFQGAPSPMLVVGFSGAGKTAWAAEQAVHTAAPVVYFDVGDLPGAVVTSAVAREAAARLFAGERASFASVLRPGASGEDALRALNVGLDSVSQRPVVILDNAHRLAPDVVGRLVSAAPRLQWVILGQPTAETAQLEARLQTSMVQLRGWSDEQIAAVFGSCGVPLSHAECGRVRRITAAQPMYVLNAAQLVARLGANHVTSWCDDIERGHHDTTTVQELVLERVWDTLSPGSRDAAAVLAAVDVALSVEDAKSLFAAGGMPDPQASAVIRELRRWTLLSQASGGEVSLHDAFRMVARQRWEEFEADRRNAVQEALLKVLLSPVLRRRDSRHFALLLRTLVEAGRSREFMDIVSNQSEALFEFGLAEVTERLARNLRDTGTITAEDRFWLTDVLAFLAATNSRSQEFVELVREMEEVMTQFAPGPTERGAYFTKKLASVASKVECDAVYAAARPVIAGNPVYERIIQYQYALGLYRVGALPEALAALEELAGKYFVALGLAPSDLLYAKTASVAAKVSKAPGWEEEGKRFADVLALIGQVRDKLGLHPLLNTIWAMKLYDVTSSYTSLINTGQDAADHFIAAGDFEGARELLEQQLLPAVRQLKMVEHAFRVRSQYAVVLAYCGKIADAREELNRLATYKGPTPLDEATFQRQRQLVEEIAGGHHLLPAHKVTPPAALSAGRKVGRNEKCPCGSGKKSKHCHGR
jgi:hypothetical protein